MSAHQFSFYVPSLCATDATVELAGEEHHHLARVLRMGAGAEIRVTNGLGLAVDAVVDTVTGATAVARVTRVAGNEPRPVRLVLALAALERAHFEAALAGAVEAGITGLVPVVAERCRPRAAAKLDAGRLERVAVAAMKQSGRAWLPRIDAPLGVDELAARAGEFARVVLAEAGAPPLPAGPAAASAADTLAVVGPEAGFTDGEVRRLRAAGAAGASISDHRLRAETAAVVLVAMLAPRGRQV